MSALGLRIKSIIEEKGLTQSQLARLVGVKQQTISYICAVNSPASTSRYATKIAQVLGVNPAWLQSGEGDRHDPMVRIELEGIQLFALRVPLLAHSEVVSFIAERDERRATGKQGKILMTDSEVGDGSFAIEIEGESMAPRFYEGDRVVIDPTLPAEPGDFVVAHVEGVITFRKFRRRDGDVFELVPLNDDWPVIRSDSKTVKVLGVMAEHRSYRRKK